VESSPQPIFSAEWGRADSVASVVSVHVGTHHTCALPSTGSLWCWGNMLDADFYGRPVWSLRPKLVPRAAWGRHAVTGVNVGFGSTCVTLVHGEVHCWGRNEYGQLGRGEVGVGGEPVLPRRGLPVLLPSMQADAQTNATGILAVQHSHARFNASGAPPTLAIAVAGAARLGMTACATDTPAQQSAAGALMTGLAWGAVHGAVSAALTGKWPTHPGVGPPLYTLNTRMQRTGAVGEYAQLYIAGMRSCGLHGDGSLQSQLQLQPWVSLAAVLHGAWLKTTPHPTQPT